MAGNKQGERGKGQETDIQAQGNGEALIRTSSRLPAVDALRGLIIVLMAMDHANYFVAQRHSTGEYWGGPFPHYEEALPFLTRLVTHLAAPGFFTLMGIGMALFAQTRRRQGWSRRRVTGHFWIRGALLMVFQILIVNQAWALSPGGWAVTLYIGVLFALGWGMFAGAALVWLKPRVILALALVFLVGTEILTPDPAQWGQAFSYSEHLSLVPGGDRCLWVNYPVLAWLELLFLGMALGRWMDDKPQATMRRALWAGFGLLLVFVAIRWLDGFGNIRPRAGDSWIDFLNPVKYPPSIAFNALTMGVNLILLGLFDRLERAKGWERRGKGRSQIENPLLVFGRVPLFFYVTHLFLYAGLGRWLAPQGTTILRMLPVWLLGLALLYPLCQAYAALKRRPGARRFLRYL